MQVWPVGVYNFNLPRKTGLSLTVNPVFISPVVSVVICKALGGVQSFHYLDVSMCGLTWRSAKTLASLIEVSEALFTQPGL